MSENKVIDTEVKVTDANPETQTPAQQPETTQAPVKEGKIAWLKRKAKEHKTGLIMITAGIAGAVVGILGTKALEKKKSETEYLPYYPEDDEDEDECFDDDDELEDDDEESEDDSAESELE